jgi:hypothetical protein
VTLHAAMEWLEGIIWCVAVIALFRAIYFGLRMGMDLKGPSGAPAASIPLLVEDDELSTPEGRRYRTLFHRWLLIFFALVPLDMLLMNYWHG